MHKLIMFHFSFSFISKQILNIDWNMNFEEKKKKKNLVLLGFYCGG